jgi:hypothetical protein
VGLDEGKGGFLVVEMKLWRILGTGMSTRNGLQQIADRDDDSEALERAFKNIPKRRKPSNKP